MGFKMKKALVVDDTKNIRQLLSKCLEVNDFLVTSCSNGEEAIRAVDSELFDLIFLDVKMPGISGTEILKYIRENGIQTRVIMITAFATVKNAIDCTKLGVVDYLHKPFTSEKISSVIKKIDEEKEVVEQIKEIEKLIIGAKKLISYDKYKDAIIILKRALSINPEKEEIYFLLAECYKGIGEIDKATKFYSCYQNLKS